LDDNSYMSISTDVYLFSLKDDYILEYRVHSFNDVSHPWAIGLKYIYDFMDSKLKRTPKDIVYQICKETNDITYMTIIGNDKRIVWTDVRCITSEEGFSDYE
jgi:hypothetical protein